MGPGKNRTKWGPLDIQDQYNLGLIPRVGINTTTLDKTYLLLKMGEMKNTQSASLRAYLWACRMDKSLEALINYYSTRMLLQK